MKKQILFVDDDKAILEVLEDLLSHRQDRWDMRFITGGEAAMAELDQRPFDVIVSDMRMPGVDGPTLLQHVHEKRPAMARIVLSGYAELEASMRAARVAHQFLTKPCDPDVLENVIDRACTLHTLIGDPTVRTIVGRVQRLPSLPTVYSDLLKVLADPNASPGTVSQVLERDVAMCAKTLQITNSAFFGLGRPVASIEEAVTFLGFNMVKCMALSAHVFGAARTQTIGFDLEAAQRHSLLTASIASKLLSADRRLSEDAFMAGVLHDVGKLLIAFELPEHMTEAIAYATAKQMPLYRAEEDLYRVTHAEVGGYLLGLWGLPYPVVEAVTHHHAPLRVAQDGLDVLTAVHVANALAHEVAQPNHGGRESTIEPGYLESLGLEDRLDDWRTVAEHCAESRLSVG